MQRRDWLKAQKMTPTACWKLDSHHSVLFHLLLKVQWTTEWILVGMTKCIHTHAHTHSCTLPNTRSLTDTQSERKFYRFWHFWLRSTPQKSRVPLAWKLSIDHRQPVSDFYMKWIESAVPLLSSAIPEVMKENS